MWLYLKLLLATKASPTGLSQLKCRHAVHFIHYSQIDNSALRANLVQKTKKHHKNKDVVKKKKSGRVRMKKAY